MIHYTKVGFLYLKFSLHWKADSHLSAVEEPSLPGETQTNEPIEGSATNQTDQQAEEDNPFKGDWTLANIILLVRDGIWYLEYCRAVSSGDTGRIWEILKVN